MEGRRRSDTYTRNPGPCGVRVVLGLALVPTHMSHVKQVCQLQAQMYAVAHLSGLANAATIDAKVGVVKGLCAIVIIIQSGVIHARW